MIMFSFNRLVIIWKGMGGGEGGGGVRLELDVQGQGKGKTLDLVFDLLT